MAHLGVAGCALLGLAYLLPGHYLPWATFQGQAASALGVALLVSAILLRSRAAGGLLRVPPLAMLALIVSAVPPLQFAAGLVHFHVDALLAGVYLHAFALAFVAGAAAGADRSLMLNGLCVTLLAAAIVSVALALMQWLQLGLAVWVAEMSPAARPGGNLAQPNQLATLLCLGFVAALHLLQAGRIGWSTVALVSAWLGLGLLMTQSRTGWLSLLFICAWYAAQKRRIGLPVPLHCLACGLALLLIGAASWDPLNDALLLSQPKVADRVQAGTRLQHWAAMWDAAWRAPWTGHGWQQVGAAQQLVADDHPPVGEMIENSHNLLLDLMVWNGAWIGLIVSALLAAWFLRRMIICRDPAQFTLVAAVGVIAGHSMLEYPLDHAYFLLLLGLFAGMLEPDGTGLRLPRRLARAWLAGLVALGGWIGSEYLVVEQANRDLRLMLAGYGLDKVAEVPPPDVVLLDGPREYHRFMMAAARPGMAEAEIAWMHRVTQRYGFPPALMRFALAAGLNGQGDVAALTLKRICLIHREERCTEARESWREAQQRFPALTAVDPP